jgi:hypothetical protein
MVSETLNIDFFSVYIFDPLSLRIIRFSIKFYFIQILASEFERGERVAKKKKIKSKRLFISVSS